MKQVKNFNVGPSELFPGVDKFLAEFIQNGSVTMPHRTSKFQELYKWTEKSFKDFFQIPDDYSIFFPYSATDGMDILIEGIVEDSITHVSNGTFGQMFLASSKTLQKDVKILQTQDAKRVEISKIQIEDDCFIITANETSTGMSYSREEIQEIRKNNADKVMIVDATSSFGALNYDISSADAWILSVQKNLGLPSGLGVLIVNQKLIDYVLKREAEGRNVGGHNSLAKLHRFHEVYHTPSTPNTLLIAGLGFICEEYSALFGDISRLDEFTKKKADYFYDAIAGIEGIFVYNEGHGRSQTTFVLELTPEKLLDVNEKLLENGYSVSPGLFELQGKVIRIANFPVHKMSDLEALVALLK